MQHFIAFLLQSLLSFFDLLPRHLFRIVVCRTHTLRFDPVNVVHVGAVVISHPVHMSFLLVLRDLELLSELG